MVTRYTTNYTIHFGLNFFFGTTVKLLYIIQIY